MIASMSPRRQPVSGTSERSELLAPGDERVGGERCRATLQARDPGPDRGAITMSSRKTKEVRRDEVLEAALEAFAELGLHGASTEDIARRAGISQPYVFRLFAT